MNKIIIFSPIRTGSTLVYNYLKKLLNIEIIKLHTITKKYIDYYYKEKNVFTIRHPYNSIISMLIIKYKIKNIKEIKNIDEKNILRMILYYIRLGGNESLKIPINENILILKYELFNNNNKIIIENIEKFFNIKILEEKKEEILKELNKENIKQNYINKLENFKNFDKETLLHGNHISILNGETNYKKLLTEKQIKILKKNEILEKIKIKFGYND